MNYHIHRFLTAMVSGKTSDLTEGYNHYLRHFAAEADGSVAADYEVRPFSDFQLPNEPHRVSDSLVSFGNGVYFPHDKYAVIFEKGRIVEYTTYANRATHVWLQTLLLRKGASLVHSAGIALGGKGIIFPAFGGSGKTFLVEAFRHEKSFQFFGDDYVIVDEQGAMHSYPSDFSVYPYHLPAFPELRGTAYAHYLMKRKIFAPYFWFVRAVNFAAKRFLSRGAPLFTGWHASYVKVPAATLIAKENMGESVPLSASIFLTRETRDDIVMEEMDLASVVREITGILNVEFGAGLDYLDALAACGQLDRAAHEAAQRAITEKCFSKVKRYRVRIPRTMLPAVFQERMVALVKSIL